MVFRAGLLVTAGLVIGLAIAPVAQAERWHGGSEHHHHGGNAAGAAIIGGLVGLGLGVAIASSGGYYAPPYGYYAPPPAYYTPPPPPVYYGYGY